MIEEEKKAIDELTMKAITSSAEAPDYPNCIVMKKDLIAVLNLIQKQESEINKLNNVIDKIKWKPIKEYDRQKYDWVLVKYFDGDYECVPEVAEQRNDGKWYTSERQIPFEVKYFFDMQILKEDK